MSEKLASPVLKHVTPPPPYWDLGCGKPGFGAFSKMKIEAQPFTTRKLVDLIDRQKIRLQPDFQRQEIWPVKKRKMLIDTILRGWVVPPIHMVLVSPDTYELLDGQQRLTSLRDFCHNRFAIDGSLQPPDNYVMSLAGDFYGDLDTNERKAFDSKIITAFVISEFKPEEPSELFYRLNQPSTLTSGEKRNSLYGPAREQLKELVSRLQDKGNEVKSLGFSNVRLAYDDVLARCLFFLEAGSLRSKGTEAKISQRFRDTEPFDETVMTKIEDAIEFFSEARYFSDRSRFNKASLMSWLIFYSRFSGYRAPNPEFLTSYLNILKHADRTEDYVHEAAEVFEDRASLRVTDVSSVIYRDFALNYIYHFTGQGALPPSIDVSDLEAVRTYRETAIDASFEGVLEEALEIDAWSRTL